MLKVSDRGNSMPESPMRKLVPYAEAAEKNGIHIYHLNIGQPDISSPKKALNAIRNHNIDILSYSPSDGFESYRKKLSHHYSKQNINLLPDDIIVTAGGSEALSFAVSCIFDPGDEVLIPEPYYANYLGFATALGVKVVPIECSINDDFSLPANDKLSSLITPRTKAIILCNPGNPTGRLCNDDELEQIRTLAIKNSLFVISDEVYREFTYDGKIHTSILSLKGLEQYGVLIDSVSKRYSLCGARIGLLASKNKDIMRAAMKFAQSRLSPPTLAQIVAEAALETEDDYFEKVKIEYVKRRNYMVERLNAIPGVKCPIPSGAFYCIAELPINNSDDFCKWMLESFSHKKETVMMAPGSGFYTNKETGLNQVRLAYVLDVKDLSRAMTCLEIGLEKYKAR
ncbi:MAG: Aspartate aminotransferase [Owenweeksia sp. TMED14]|nr:MAG: Aspartate aminotransferase [Owenweeksia sp. TMED14]